ncbi:MAG: elongation factor Ts [Candidatus Pacebacteria bacterium]|jgi:elongation factor Ts|nr:elongation factor Ts [Candidatus Paceibacterota bacterium]
MISSDVVKELRDKTGISVMQCKAALEEAGGDMEKALMLLRKKGSSIADKKGDRVLASGIFQTYTHANKKVASVVELLSETDFVSKHEDFAKLAYDIALQIAATNPEYKSRADVPEEMMTKIKDMYVAEVAGKPENLKETILSGKIDAYLKNIVLLEQLYIKDDSLTVKQLIDNAVQKFGERIEIGDYKRFSTK